MQNIRYACNRVSEGATNSQVPAVWTDTRTFQLIDACTWQGIHGRFPCCTARGRVSSNSYSSTSHEQRFFLSIRKKQLSRAATHEFGNLSAPGRPHAVSMSVSVVLLCCRPHLESRKFKNRPEKVARGAVKTQRSTIRMTIRAVC